MLPLVSHPSHERKAIHRPLGEYCGWDASNFHGVIRRKPLPSKRMVKIACMLSEFRPRSNAIDPPCGDQPGDSSKKLFFRLLALSDLSVT